MTIKELAYSAQQYLQTSTGSSFKRTHIYELLAASFGFNSYAALSAEAVFTRRRPDSENSLQSNSIIRQRCVELGYPAATADIASSVLPTFVEKRRIDVVKLPDLVAELRGLSSYQNEYPEWDDDDQLGNDSDEMFASTWPNYQDEDISPILLDGLESAASKGNALAHYALALIHAPSDDERNREVGSSYWYSQAQQGRVLTGVQKEWADAYAQQLAKAEKYVHHLREATRLGNEYALLDLAERFNDPSFFEGTYDAGVDDPMRVAEIAERLGRTEDVRRWLTIAAEAGNTEAMRQLIEEHDHGDLQRCWMWLYLAQMVGTDLTADHYYAIHEDGSPYDDDIGGPIYVSGYDGVKLDPLNAEQDAAARRTAEELFKRIRQTK